MKQHEEGNREALFPTVTNTRVDAIGKESPAKRNKKREWLPERSSVAKGQSSGLKTD
jgi:hypothetical protein